MSNFVKAKVVEPDLGTVDINTAHIVFSREEDDCIIVTMANGDVLKLDIDPNYRHMVYYNRIYPRETKITYADIGNIKSFDELSKLLAEEMHMDEFEEDKEATLPEKARMKLKASVIPKFTKSGGITSPCVLNLWAVETYTKDNEYALQLDIVNKYVDKPITTILNKNEMEFLRDYLNDILNCYETGAK